MGEVMFLTYLRMHAWTEWLIDSYNVHVSCMAIVDLDVCFGRWPSIIFLTDMVMM